MVTDPEYWKGKFVFPSVYEGMRKTLGDKITPETKRKVKELGLDLDRLPPAIEGQLSVRIYPVIAAGAWPTETRDEQLRLLGLWAIRGWRQGLLGSAAAQMLKLVGPRRALQRLDRAFATSDNFSKSTTEFLSDSVARVTINDPGDLRTHWVGILEAGMELVGRSGVVTLEPITHPVDIHLRVEWQ